MEEGAEGKVVAIDASVGADLPMEAPFGSYVNLYCQLAGPLRCRAGDIRNEGLW